MIHFNENEYTEYISSGLFKSDGNWRHPKRVIDSYEIIFMYEGNAYICEDGREYILSKNDILFLEPGKEHYGFRTTEDFVSFAWLHYKTNCEKYKNMEKHFKVSNPSALKNLFTQCMHVANTPNYDPVCTDLYAALFAEEILFDYKINSGHGNQLAAQIKEYVTVNTEKNLTVAKVAEYFGYNENHISRVFKAAYGIKLKDYISEKKTEYASALLCTTLYTVKQISRMLSFQSENHFIKFFKYHTEMTPTKYRNTYTNMHINKA